MMPVQITKKMAKDRKLIDKLLRAGLTLQIVKKQPSRWDRD